jgi:archaellum component FlaC
MESENLVNKKISVSEENNINDIIEMKKEISEMKNDIKDLKKTIADLVETLEISYKFD